LFGQFCRPFIYIPPLNMEPAEAVMHGTISLRQILVDARDRSSGDGAFNRQIHLNNKPEAGIKCAIGAIDDLVRL